MANSWHDVLWYQVLARKQTPRSTNANAVNEATDAFVCAAFGFNEEVFVKAAFARTTAFSFEATMQSGATRRAK
jgi:hypothetical protein